MPREGTRSATGNSKPRVFQTVDTAPAIKRTNKPKAKKAPTASTKVGTKVKAAKPTGVTKKKSAAPKKDGVATKVKAAVKKAEEKADKAGEKVKKAVAKPKTATK
ncbi:hypothetical protein F4677DRAFT_441545 [Hypoxylon crocopeplum]|nr:hypothetical protein F4677DRAFT_441545 [Hypoxylon crocopeplum]